MSGCSTRLEVLLAAHLISAPEIVARSCAVNPSRAGVHETVASKYMNRKMLAIYKQYRIVDTRDMELAGEALENYSRIRKE